MNIEKIKKIDIGFLLCLYLGLFVNFIDLFAKATNYVGRILFILVNIIGFLFFIYRYIKDEKYKNNDSLRWYIIYTFIMYIYVLINGLVNKNFTKLFYGGYQYIIYSLVFFTFLAFMKKDKVEKYLNCILAINLVNAIICIYEYLNKTNIFLTDYGQIAFEGEVIYRGRAFYGSFLNGALALTICSLITLYFIIKAVLEKKKKSMYGYSGLLVIFLVGLFSTGSRGPLVALLVSIAIVYMIYSLFISENKKRNIKIIISMIVAGIIGLILILQIDVTSIENSSVSFFIHRIQTIFDWSNDPGNVGRIERWKLGLDLFKTKPIFGIGIASTGAKGLGEFSLMVTESGVIKKLAEMGIVGFVIYYIHIIYSQKVLFKELITNKTNSKKHLLLLLALVIILAILVEEFIYQALESEIIGFYLYFMFALIFNKYMKKTID